MAEFEASLSRDPGKLPKIAEKVLSGIMNAKSRFLATVAPKPSSKLAVAITALGAFVQSLKSANKLCEVAVKKQDEVRAYVSTLSLCVLCSSWAA